MGHVADLNGIVRDWFTRTFVDSAEVLEVVDPERGVMEGKATFQVRGDQPFVDDGITGFVRYNIRVEVKDGRVRCTLGQFVHQSTWSQWQVSFGLLTTVEDPGKQVFSMKKWRIQNHAQLKAEAARNAGLMIESLRRSLTEPPKADAW